MTDVIARYKRMRGYNVLFPMGFHFTGTPIISMADALARGDKELEDIFVNLYDVPKEIIPKLTDPLFMARYFSGEAKQAMIEAGFSIDWRREFTTIDPEFNKFIVWQFEKLREKGFITRGTHPVGWCPRDQMPVGMHDTKGDVEPEIGEFTLLFFKLDDGAVLPAATLRPETVYGAVNVWVNPDAEYVEIEVDGKERWIVSAKAAWKLSFQNRRIKEIRKLKGEELIGKRAVNPATKKLVPVLPASFVDPDTGTGVVMSVPAHAPFDYAALRDIVKNEELLRKLGVDPKELEPVPVLEVEGYGRIPAAEIVEKMGIKSQEEKEKLEEATKKIYSDEYHKGVMIVEPVKGLKVPEAREKTVELLSKEGLADKMYEIMNKPVYCRCGAEVVVKILDNQWFLNYGDPRWKELARKLLSSMDIVPDEVRKEFEFTIEWLRERACARTRGLGTKLPWEEGWIIESLSDSTIYMAFYTVIHKIRRYGIKPDQLTLEFWDYVLLGKGSPEEVSKKTGIPVEQLKDLRAEFDYWYPLDNRHSGRDLVPNHLTFFIFNHAAIFPEEKWPKRMVVNGFVLYMGKKMSKSLRNIVPLRRALREYGADTVRAALIAAAELLQDADFTPQLAEGVAERLRRFYETILEYTKGAGEDRELNLYDKWMLSRIQRHVEAATKAMEEYKLREAIQHALFLMDQDYRRYLQYVKDKPARKVLEELADTWTRLLAPFTPHIAEEAWSALGREGFVSLAKWPEPKPELLDIEAELAVEYLERLINDTMEILRVTGKKPEKAVFYVASREDYENLALAVKAISEGKAMRDFIREIVARSKDKARAAKEARKLYELAVELPENVREAIASGVMLDEKKVIEEALDIIKERIGASEIEVYLKTDESAPGPKAKREAALPFKPAIFIE